jgi:hypothetical protein
MKDEVKDEVGNEVKDEIKDEMKDEVKDILIHAEKEKEIRFTLPFKWILAISIFFTGILSFFGITYFTQGLSEKTWVTIGINNFLYNSLFLISIMFCFAALISIAVIKKPFSKILVWCFMTIGILFVISSITFTHIAGYHCSNFRIFSFGKFTLADGTIFIIGVLGILFSRVIHYGFMYQRNTDMIV